jgi:hypothetical protein
LINMSSKITAVQSAALATVRASRVYVDNKGASTLNAQTYRSLLTRGLIRVNGASRVRLDNGRTGRRIVLTIAGRNALGA